MKFPYENQRHTIRDDGSIDVEVVNDDPTLCQQQHAADADINNIMRKYESQGILPELILQDPKYGDFSDVPSYQEACNIVRMANEQFLGLSAEVRDRFNTPEKFLEFCQNPANQREMIQMGLATEKMKPEAPKAAEAPIVPASVPAK